MKGELQLERVEDVKDDDLVPAEAQVLDALRDLFLIVHQVADEDDNAAPLHLSRDLAERIGDRRLLGRDERGEHLADLMNLRERVGAGLILAHLRIENAHGHGVALKQDEVGEARGDGPPVIEL